MSADFAEKGVSLEYIQKLNVDAGEEYLTNLTAVVDKLIEDDIDLVVVYDYRTLCMDFVPAAKAVDWTPRALYFNLCGQDTAAMAELGTDVSVACFLNAATRSRSMALDCVRMMYIYHISGLW